MFVCHASSAVVEDRVLTGWYHWWRNGWNLKFPHLFCQHTDDIMSMYEQAFTLRAGKVASAMKCAIYAAMSWNSKNSQHQLMFTESYVTDCVNSLAAASATLLPFSGSCSPTNRQVAANPSRWPMNLTTPHWPVVVTTESPKFTAVRSLNGSNHDSHIF